MYGYDDFEDRSHLVVLVFVVAAVLALGYHFRDGLFALFGSDHSAVASVTSPASAAQTDPIGEALFRAEQSVPQLPGVGEQSLVSAAHTEQVATGTLPAPVTIGYYLALSDTPVRAAPTSSAETVAFVYQGQQFLVVGSSGEYVEIRSINRERHNPPGFVLRADVAFIG